MSTRPQCFDVAVALSLLVLDRRAQEYLSDSVSASATSDDEDYLQPEEPTIEEDQDAEIEAAREEQPYDALVSNLQWDEDLTPGPVSQPAVPSRRHLLPQRTSSQASDTPPRHPAMQRSKAEERTPLLRTSPDKTYLSHPETTSGSVAAFPVGTPPVERAMSRRPSQLSDVRAARRPAGKFKGISGHSTYGQTVSTWNYWMRGLSQRLPPAIQCDCNSTWDRNAFRAVGVRLRRVDRRHGYHRLLWLDYLLHVSTYGIATSTRMNLSPTEQRSSPISFWMTPE